MNAPPTTWPTSTPVIGRASTCSVDVAESEGAELDGDEEGGDVSGVDCAGEESGGGGGGEVVDELEGGTDWTGGDRTGTFRHDGPGFPGGQ
jgi:hypothetical protein